MTASACLLPGETAETAARVELECLDVPAAARESLLAELHRDTTRETPSRRRLFRLLVGRAARRRPLLLLPIVHSSSPLGVTEREAWGIVRVGPGRVRVVRASAPERAEEMSSDELAETFVEEHFA
ncbi:MAG: hypothetical protein M0D55_01055 [Elusimicrobiota bacterium]|nr:MAG: hypothetical protein M0D55_01055 [Elusimicrobiota bacterium]